ncbi:MAG: hydroxyisourate hydrolase [Propioniciclava sp.]|uniref:hydroxyisourate hydrolase n=1 Tax=Propioniciclava sp. TaxID=2038686 RepID=UPI0039E36CB3
MISHLTTHILDATSGMPASGVEVVLTTTSGDEIARGLTDADGRLGLGPQVLAEGDYALVFATGAYFSSHGVEAFYPQVSVAFTVGGRAHYHVPLLLSPFAYSTYRGS